MKRDQVGSNRIKRVKFKWQSSPVQQQCASPLHLPANVGFGPSGMRTTAARGEIFQSVATLLQWKTPLPQKYTLSSTCLQSGSSSMVALFLVAVSISCNKIGDNRIQIWTGVFSKLKGFEIHQVPTTKLIIFQAFAVFHVETTQQGESFMGCPCTLCP